MTSPRFGRQSDAWGKTERNVPTISFICSGGNVDHATFIRALSRQVAQAYLDSRAAMTPPFPMLADALRPALPAAYAGVPA